MRHGVPFACQRRPIIGVLRMCWLLPGSIDCFCCPHTSVHRPSIACLAVFLCGPGALFLHALSRPSTICPFPPHGWSAPDGLPLLLRKQPIWAAGDTPHLMPVEQGLPWHPPHRTARQGGPSPPPFPTAQLCTATHTPRPHRTPQHRTAGRTRAAAAAPGSKARHGTAKRTTDLRAHALEARVGEQLQPALGGRPQLLLQPRLQPLDQAVHLRHLRGPPRPVTRARGRQVRPVPRARTQRVRLGPRHVERGEVVEADAHGRAAQQRPQPLAVGPREAGGAEEVPEGPEGAVDGLREAVGGHGLPVGGGVPQRVRHGALEGALGPPGDHDAVQDRADQGPVQGPLLAGPQQQPPHDDVQQPVRRDRGEHQDLRRGAQAAAALSHTVAEGAEKGPGG